MATSSQHQAVLDTVVMLADQIARTSPEFTDPNMQIVQLVQALAPTPHRDLIKDTMDLETTDADV